MSGIGIAQVQVPSLDWLDPSGTNTFYFEVSNETETVLINATISNRTSDDDVTILYWTRVNGSKTILVGKNQNVNRSDLNISEFMTYLWVNRTNVLEDGAILGWDDYDEVVNLNYFEFKNETRTFYYDLDSGWLEKAVYPGGVEVNLVATAHIDDLPDPPDLLVGDLCDGEEPDDDWDQDEDLTIYVSSEVCLKGPNQDPCNIAWESRVHVRWPTWHIFRYKAWLKEDGDEKWSDDDWSTDYLLATHLDRTIGDRGNIVDLPSGESKSTSAYLENMHTDVHVAGYNPDSGQTSADLTC